MDRLFWRRGGIRTPGGTFVPRILSKDVHSAALPPPREMLFAA